MVDKKKTARVAPSYTVDGDGKLHLNSVSLVAEGFHVDPHVTMVSIEESTPFTKEDYLKILESTKGWERDQLMYGRFDHSDPTKDVSEE